MTLSWLTTFSWPALRHHPWRHGAAVVAVMLGVALALSVHLINRSALSEFASAARTVQGEPDLTLRATRGLLDEALLGWLARQPQVALASPVLEREVLALRPDGTRLTLRLVGVDALNVAALAPALLPVLDPQANRLDLLAPDTLFPNGAALQALGGDTIRLQSGLTQHRLRVAGRLGASGPPLAVLDIAAAQDLLGLQGRLSRIDLRLRPGADRTTLLRALPPDVTASEPADTQQRIGALSRAYRVNLTVLALVALFTGAFLVFSVLSLSVAQRAPQFALLGVLGLTPRERLRLVLAESLLLGAVGSVAGVALGAALAALALRLLGGDLGGGYFIGVAPPLAWDGGAAAAYGALGLLSALVGGWWPARTAQTLPPAQTLKGLGTLIAPTVSGALSTGLMLAGAGLALLPPVAGLPLAAYGSVALLLVGGILALPQAVALLYDRLAPRVARHPLALLAVERARRQRGSAAVAVGGVVAALSLAVALTVMVASFRDSFTRWLDLALPADLYLRTASTAATGDTAYLPPGFAAAAAQLPGVRRLGTLRAVPLQFDARRPAVTLLARDIATAAENLPLVAAARPVPDGQIGIYVSEAMVDLYGARPGATFPALATAFPWPAAGAGKATFFVAGVWRDYVRQFGAIIIDRTDFERLSGDRRVNDLALWLQADADAPPVQTALRRLARDHGGDADSLEFSSAREVRARSLQLFDRSFAVTYWLQAVAIGIGLFGVAASFSAQVLARRKEFGLLAHLGLTRRQILTVVAGEGAAWTLIGAMAGLALGLAVSMVLVYVVNPQSFHWSMDLSVPWLRLLALCAAVVVAGTGTAWLTARAAAGRDAVLAVKEDW